VARNRKRAKERRSRRAASSALSPSRAATAPAESDDVTAAHAESEDVAPAPIEHAAPDVELADAQLAVGRPQLDDGLEAELDAEEIDQRPVDELELESDASDTAADADSAEGDAAGPPAARIPASPVRSGSRLVLFLQGSWRELQRVQWPDRRQVMQATGVVIGFVIVAGVFLALSDTLAARIMDFILK